MLIKQTTRGILLEGIDHFDPVHIFECGQAFRWNWDGEGYTGIVRDKMVRMVRMDGGFELQKASIEDFQFLWQDYFDLGRDYENIKTVLSQDFILKEAVEYGSGIRILNQDSWETLISFIISTNNNIPRIKRIIESLSRGYGQCIKEEYKEYYAFPEPGALARASEHELKACGCGYRAAYIKKTAQMVYEGKVDLAMLKEASYSSAVDVLLSCPGVGRKVADCVLLFSAGKTEAFPVDVWIRRTMGKYCIKQRASDAYIRQYAGERFGAMAGFAQQYLFYYSRWSSAAPSS